MQSNYKAEYRRVLARIHKRDIIDCYKMVLLGPVDERRLHFLTIEEEQEGVLTEKQKDKSVEEKLIVILPFDKTDDIRSIITNNSVYKTHPYFIRIDTYVPSRYYINSISDFQFRFPFSFLKGFGELLTLESITGKEKIILDWYEDNGMELMEIDILRL